MRIKRVYEEFDEELNEGKSVVILDTRRSDYSPFKAANKSITVGELIDILENFDEDCKIVTSHDNGYTYGNINSNDLDEVEDDDE